MRRIEGSQYSVTDTGSASFTDLIVDGQNEWLQIRQTFPLPSSARYTLLLKVSDGQRKSGSTQSISIDKTDARNAQNFLVRNAISGLVIPASLIKVGDSIRVESLRNREKPVLHVFRLDSEIKLPPAPFSSASPEYPMVSEATHSSVFTTDGFFSLKVEQGLYLVSTDLLPEKGLSFSGVSGEYPWVKSKNQLYPPLRYLTTKQEFESIIKARNPKEKVDKFWVDCGGSKDRARALLEAFYSRVELSNREFTSYTEGWRTDRGMIYLIFGEPSKVLRSSDQETWIYGEEESSAALRFQFKKINSIWSDNIFALNRDPMYKTHWERMVTAWRNGRIYTN